MAKRKVSIACVALVVLLSQCTTVRSPSPAGARTETSDRTIKIAVLVPLSGPVPSFGTSTRDGALLAIEEWNAKGGVLGRRIVPIVEDGQCTADPALRAAHKVIDQDQVHYIIGEVCSSASIPVSEYANSQEVVQITGTSTNPAVTVGRDGKTKNYIFRACFIDPYQGILAAQFALQKGFREAFVMFDHANDYVTELAEAFEAAFLAKGGRIVGRETYTSRDIDFSSILGKVDQAKPDVVYLPDYYNIVNLVTRQAKEGGITTPFLGGDGWDSSDLDLEAAAGSYFTNHYWGADKRPEVGEFIRKYRARYGVAPDALAALFYDAANILIQAIAYARVDDTDRVRAALEQNSFNTVTGWTSFDSKHNPVKPGVVLAVRSAGVEFEANVSP